MDPTEAWQELESLGLKIAYSSEEENCHLIFGYFFLPDVFQIKNLDCSPVYLMNMIFSEQVECLNQLFKQEVPKGLWITSGIRKEEEEIEYKKQIIAWGGKIIEEKGEEEWKAFVFSIN